MRLTGTVAAIGGLLLGAGCCCSSCWWNTDSIHGSGNLVTKDMGFAGFTEVRASSAFHVEIRRGGGFSVEVTADDNVWPYVRAEQQGGSVYLGMRSVSLHNATFRAVVTMPTIEKIELGAAVDVTMTGFRSVPSLAIEASGAGNLNGDVEAERLSLDIDAASAVELSGSVRDLTAKLGGASKARLRDLTVTGHARIEGDAASNADITVTGKLEYELDGASHLEYGGNPQVGRADVSGASHARPR